ncbi:hypothetical protein BU17DRAFT_49021 [Hysterangium stoloniferum]|nr:hypothetical protein BU17DRAFT_49021 [Hysterangium stoloniferum]
MSKYLEFPRTDGSPQKWPVDKLDSTPSGGEVNFMLPIPFDDPLSIKWRIQVGREVAKLLGLEDFKEYSLKDFPEGYKFYLHHKGDVVEPRTDPYLYGGSSGRFRSPPEFIRHAYWLLTDDTLNRRNCGCKYCSFSKRQSEISQDLGLNKSVSTPKPPNFIKPKVRPVARPRKHPSMIHSPVNSDRVADLRSSRQFRPGELVWCGLSPVIQGEHEDECIEFWPALVNDFSLKVDVTPREFKEKWSVSQSYLYNIRFLGVFHLSTVPEHCLLPYQAFGPSIKLIERLRAAGDPTLLKDRQRASGIRPKPMEADENQTQLQFTEAATAFALAIQIAAHLVRFWTPTHEYAFFGEVPSTSVQASSLIDNPPVLEIKEPRHEGLWWGAEKIWVDELVRVQSGRAQVHPRGSQLIHRPSPRADGRGVLMRVNAIITVPGSSRDSLRNCKVSGVLYELADEAYEEEISDSSTIMQEMFSSDIVGPSEPNKPPSVLVAPPGSVLTPFSGQGIMSNKFATSETNPFQGGGILPLSLPDPPPGYKFRSIMKPGYEIVLDVAFISGRYYPNLLKHPLLQNTLADVNPDDPRVSQLTALCGLVTGAVNSMECVDWVATRVAMLRQADTTARQDLSQHWTTSINELDPESMDVDIM